MASYFWMAGLSGGYGTHGDTFVNNSDDSTEVRWWAKGGLLVGESPDRIKFFRSIMEKAPVKGMTPEIFHSEDSTNLNSNIHIFSKPGAYYLAFVGDSDQNIKINLERDTDYQMDIIDTWNMKNVERRPYMDYNFEKTIGKILRCLYVDRDKTFQLFYDGLARHYDPKKEINK